MKAMRCVEPNTKTISRSTDNDIRVYHFIMDFFSSCARLLLLLLPLRFFFLLRFLNSLSEVVAKEERSKILTWQLYYECNYCPPTKFLIYDQILDPFETRLICSGTVVVAALKQDFKKSSTLITFYQNCYVLLDTKNLYIFHSDSVQQMLKTFNFLNSECWRFFGCFWNCVGAHVVLTVVVYVMIFNGD